MASTVRHKYFDTLAHTFLSTLWLMGQRCDAALYCNAANAVFTILSRLRGIPVALNVDGIERKRRKWNWFAKTWYLFSEYLATLFPNRIISDAKVIQDYYLQRYSKVSTFIAYGADARRERLLLRCKSFTWSRSNTSCTLAALSRRISRWKFGKLSKS